jgi:hypothetical protein
MSNPRRKSNSWLKKNYLSFVSIEVEGVVGLYLVVALPNEQLNIKVVRASQSFYIFWRTKFIVGVLKSVKEHGREVLQCHNVFRVL